MVLLLIGTLSVLSISTIDDAVNESRFNATLEKLNTIRDAMIGNLQVKSAGIRSNFGFLGDIGAIPSNGQGIVALTTNPGLPAYALNLTVRFGVGWNGPYLRSSTGVDYTKDAWGTTLVYDSSVSPAIIKSYGADGVANGTGYNQDITVEIPVALQTATVDGFLSNSDGTPYTGLAQVELSYPNGAGALTTPITNVAVPDAGHFTFTGVPFGIRSLSAYKNTKASPTATIGNIMINVDSATVVAPSSELKWP